MTNTGRRVTDEPITAESIRALGAVMGLTEAQITTAIDAVMKAEAE